MKAFWQALCRLWQRYLALVREEDEEVDAELRIW